MYGIPDCYHKCPACGRVWTNEWFTVCPKPTKVICRDCRRFMGAEQQKEMDLMDWKIEKLWQDTIDIFEAYPDYLEKKLEEREKDG